MKRLPDWEIKLAEFLKENRERDFEWGKWDCCIFANACLKVISGKNVIPKTLKWKDEKTAYKAIKDYGGTLDQALEKAALAAGMIPVEPQYVTTGDLVVVMNENKPVAGISDGSRVMSPTDGGYAFSLPSTIEAAWRIP
jgi:hypothetical protein